MATKKPDCASTAVSLLRDDRGLATVEYVILLVLIAIMSVAMWRTFGGAVYGKLNSAQQSFSSNVSDTPP